MISESLYIERDINSNKKVTIHSNIIEAKSKYSEKGVKREVVDLEEEFEYDFSTTVWK